MDMSVDALLNAQGLDSDHEGSSENGDSDDSDGHDQDEDEDDDLESIGSLEGESNHRA
jgi:hypothetical protein